MINIVRNSALALALLGGVALASAPALAGSYKHGHGNSWNKSAQNYAYRKNNRQAFRSYNGFSNFRGYNGYSNPGYAYYGPGPYYGYGSNYSYGRPGFSLYIR
jgi:hypothetical protein